MVDNNIIAIVFALMWIMSSVEYFASLIENNRTRKALNEAAIALQNASTKSLPATIGSNTTDRRLERVEATQAILIERDNAREAQIVALPYLTIDELERRSLLQPATAAIVPDPRVLGHGSGYSLERQSVQLQSAVAWLKANDRGLKLTIREAERLSGYPRSTINRAQHWIRNE